MVPSSFSREAETPNVTSGRVGITNSPHGTCTTSLTPTFTSIRLAGENIAPLWTTAPKTLAKTFCTL